jgi:putative RecB family exonuclease
MTSELHPAVQELSHSRLESYEKCPRAFWYAYVAKTPPDGYERIEAWTGSLIHQVLEEALRATFERKVPDPVSILQRYDELWTASTGPHILIVKEGRTLEEYRANGRQWLKNYLDDAWPFLDATPLHVEESISYSVTLADGRQTKFTGVMDRVDRLPDGRLRLIDYKTGSWVPRFDTPRDAYQLALYWRGVVERYPETTGGVLVWHYLQHRHAHRVDPEPKLIQGAQMWLASTALEIQAKLAPTADSSHSFPAKAGPLCRWCEFGYACAANPYRSTAPAPRSDS